MQQVSYIEDFLHDLRYALRQLRQNPGFAAVAGLTLAFSIGPTTTIFSVVNGVVLAPLPYSHPERLMILTESTLEFPQMGVSYMNFMDWQRQQRSFSHIAGYRQDAFNLATPDGAEVIHALTVSADFFKVMGVSPLFGRAFSAADDHIGAAPTAMLSYGFWQQHFGGAQDAVGRSITLSDKNYTVIGVLPRSFWFFQQEDVYVPIGINDLIWTHQRDVEIGMLVVGRLNPGVTQGEAQADMASIARRLAQEYPKANAGHRITITPALGFLVQNVRTTLYLLAGAVCFVLLIACVNIANLLLSRGAMREREVAIRAALGAGWQRVMRQLLTESVLLGLLGGCLGILLASVCTKQLLRYVPGELPRSDNVGLDFRVLLFAVAVSVTTGVVFGLAPTLRAAKPALNDVLKEGIRGSSGRSHRLQKGLVVAEVGLALVLLAGAGLTLESIVRLERMKIGFNPKDALTFVLELPYARYSTGANDRAFFKNLLEQLRALPSVQAAGLAGGMPLGWEIETSFHIEGRAEPQPQTMPMAMLYQTSPGYLQAMGISLLRGRDFTDQDKVGSHPVALIDGALARKFFPHVDPIGQHITVGRNLSPEIVGVVDHVEQWGPAGRKNWNIDDAIYSPTA
jgi:putative ABC transport system permease protein